MLLNCGVGEDGRRQWHPTSVLLPGKSHRQRSLVGYSPWDRKESDTTEWLHFITLHYATAFFIVQLSHPYVTTGKNIALTTWTFVGKVMSLLFNMLSRLVIIFLPRSKCILISWLQSICSDFGAQKNKVSHCFPIYLPWSDGSGYHGLSFLSLVELSETMSRGM